MLPHEDTVRLKHMKDHAIEALDMVRNKNREDLDRDRQLNLSLVRLVEIVGEAANRVSHQTQEAYPLIPWTQIVGLRNRLVHGYSEVDFDILWRIIKDDLPPLITELVKILGETAGEQ